MANLCITTVQIIDKKDNLINFEKLLQEWINRSYEDKVVEPKWLGNIIKYSGIGINEDGTEIAIPNRGTISDITLSDDLYISMSTAWGPKLKMWKLILEKYLPEAECFYKSEGESFLTNDPDYQNKYIIDSWCDGIEYNSCVDEETLLQEFAKYLSLEKDMLTVTALKTIIDDLDEDSCEATFHKWQYMSLEEIAA